MNIITEEKIREKIKVTVKPTYHSNLSLPLNFLDDRIFEILTYDLVKKLINSNDKFFKEFDNVQLMQGVGEKGMDCILLKNGKIQGIIQCKKYARNLSDTSIIEELTKFFMHFFTDNKDFSSSNKLNYYISTTTGFSGKAQSICNDINNNIFFDENRIKGVVDKLMIKFKSLSTIDASSFLLFYRQILKRVNIVQIRPDDYNIWINKYQDVMESFFDIKKVTDNELIEKSKKEIIQKMQNLISPDDSLVIGEFINNYKVAVHDKLNSINFIGFDLHRYRQRPTDITLTELFVQPTFTERNFDDKKTNPISKQNLKVNDIFNSDKNLIILGDPGAGKSLLVKFLIVQLVSSKKTNNLIKNYSNYIPFRIELRKYNEVRENKSIVEYLVDILSNEYQTQIKIDQLTKILDNYPTLIFFDGLDEIFNVNHKTKTKENIDSFCLKYTKSKSIVTSRFIGYHDIKFNSKKYDEFAIQNFNDNQISELVNKFYSTQIANQDKRSKAIKLCLLQIKKDVDESLKSNPLIMTLILILSSNNIIIPDSKLEIYEACTKTLVDTIDIKEKELKFEIPVKHKRLVFAHLAYWQYESLTKNSPINYNNAIKSISTFLLEKKEVSEYVDAEDKAKKFLEYAEKRSIYFEDNFTHKTFLEYYTADYLYINYFTKASDVAKKIAISIISSYLDNSFWYIVFELLFMRVDSEQADDELLDEIFCTQIESNNLNIIYFLIGNLQKFINVSNKVKKNIILKAIQLCIRGEKITESKMSFNLDENSLIGKIYLLTKDENLLKMLQDIFNELETSDISEKELIELYILYYEICSFKNSSEVNLLISNISQAEKLACKDIHLYSQVFLKRNAINILSINILVDQIGYFGKKSIFQEIQFKHRKNVSRIAIFSIFLINSIEKTNFKEFNKGISTLIQYGVTYKEIINHIKKDDLHYYYSQSNLENVIKFYILSNDENIILLLTLYQQKVLIEKNIKNYD